MALCHNTLAEADWRRFGYQLVFRTLRARGANRFVHSVLVFLCLRQDEFDQGLKRGGSGLGSQSTKLIVERYNLFCVRNRVKLSKTVDEFEMVRRIGHLSLPETKPWRSYVMRSILEDGLQLGLALVNVVCSDCLLQASTRAPWVLSVSS